MKLIKVVWQDHFSEAGWFDTKDVRSNGHTNISVGILITEDLEYVTIAQTIYQNEEICADLLHILVKDIISQRDLYE